MTVQGHRHQRVAEEILHEMGIMVAGELKDPRIAGLVTVTEVGVTPDLKHARVFVSVIGNQAEQKSTIRGLAAAVGYIRHELTERIQLRRAPVTVPRPNSVCSTWAPWLYGLAAIWLRSAPFNLR